MTEIKHPSKKSYEKRMEAVTEISKTINSLLDIDRILELTMDSVISLFKAERGFIMLMDETTGDLQVQIARNLDKQNLDNPEYEISRSVLREVYRTRAPLLSTNAMNDPRLKESESILNFRLRTIICVPMMIKEKLVGVIYIDSRVKFNAFTPEDLDFAIIFSHQVATAIDNAQLSSEKQRLRKLFDSRVSPEVVEEILTRSGDVCLLGEKRIVTVMFLDIRGFTALSEALDPREIVSLLNSIWEEMGEIVMSEGGTLITYLGDGMMAVFGAPIVHPDDARRAVRAAVRMQKRMESLREKWSGEQKPVLEIGIGVNTGEAVVGDVGFSKHREYAVIGDTTNLAARIEKLNKEYATKILVSESTCALLDDSFTTRCLGEARITGKSQPIRLYEIIDG